MSIASFTAPVNCSSRFTFVSVCLGRMYGSNFIMIPNCSSNGRSLNFFWKLSRLEETKVDTHVLSSAVVLFLLPFCLPPVFCRLGFVAAVGSGVSAVGMLLFFFMGAY